MSKERNNKNLLSDIAFRFKLRVHLLLMYFSFILL